MGTFNDFSQLKKFKAAEPEPPKPPPKPLTQEERALAAAADSADYFSSLLGPGETKKAKPAAPAARGVPQLHTTVVTRDTVSRVREEQVAAKHEAIEEDLREQIAVLEEANQSFAMDVATANEQIEQLNLQLEQSKRQLQEIQVQLQAANEQAEEAGSALAQANEEWKAESEKSEAVHAEEIAKLKAQFAARDEEYAKVCAALAEREEENARLRMENGKWRMENEGAAEGGGHAGRVTLPGGGCGGEGLAALPVGRSDLRAPNALLRAPEGFSEKFEGEMREHVIEALSDVFRAAEAAGRDRRARILEEVLGVNESSGALERRRAAVKRIVQEAGHKLDDTAIAALEKLGFKYVSGHNHHKLDWAGIRFPLAKTPSDYRSCLNSAAEISNRVF